MSGAEAAIAGVGFLCSAIQIVTFGRDILQVYCQVRDGRSPDPRLEGYLKSAEACFNHIKTSASATSQTQALHSDQQQIVNVGQELHDSMVELQTKFAELHLDDASKRGVRGKLRVGKKAAASMWHSKELASLEESLKRYESLLHGVILHRVSNQVQAVEAQSSQHFHHLNVHLQSFITKLADGCTNLSELSRVSLETKDRVTQEHEKTRTAIDQGFASTQGTITNIRDSTSQHFQDSSQREMSKILERRHERLLNSLRFSEMNSRKNQVSENYPGTFSWVFKNTSCSSRSHSPLTDMSTSTSSPDPDNFPIWLQSDSNLFWISGKPASGKSSLMKFLATNSLTREHLEIWQHNTQNKNGKLRIIAHYFWKPGQLLQKNIQGMVLSLLYQVLCKDLCLAQQLWEDQDDVSDKRAHGDWSLNELRETLCHAIKSSSDCFCIFLDGLDEAREFERLSWRDSGNARVIHDLLCLDNVKICASSREEHPFCLFFESQPRLRIHLLTYNDIYCYAKQRLELTGLDPHNRHGILQSVIRKADGVFLWVVLVLDSLNRAIRSGSASTRELKERLAQTPADLNDLFIDMWERPGDDAKLSSHKIDASRYLSLAVTANKLEEHLPFSTGFNNMNSLLVITTALEDGPVTSILDTGRCILAKDLEDKCSAVADRLRLVSRGLLEIVTATNGDGVEGSSRLTRYRTEMVVFIHRSAFDFITDTQFGRECLSTCGWSSTEQVSRLFAGHLVRCRFVRDQPAIINHITTGKMTYDIIIAPSHQVRRALSITYSWGNSSLSFENSMLPIIKDWQRSGLFSAQSRWKYPQGSRVPSDLWELEFLEQLMGIAPRFTIVAGALDQLQIHRLIEAIPALLRGFPNMMGYGVLEPLLCESIGYVLTQYNALTAFVVYYHVPFCYILAQRARKVRIAGHLGPALSIQDHFVFNR
ncbi:hypothetical protein FPOAC1_003582 [Fusarium poae]|uniref:hypothetical protein n=1 Tax=Fusarium poae TaxID=36050 RepID=UPI001CEAD1F0|nr:hypothetical protein FPOAC1_003582 [Fusarium poae]KAG8677558.1 hypothetical protein FPOAC1_003582 [Fusarium poae]